MSLDHIAGMLDVLDGIDPFDDEQLWRRRQALVAAAGLDEDTIVAKCFAVFATRVAFSDGFFDIEFRGIEPEPAFISGVLDYRETLVDLLAWPIARPAAMATLGKRAVMLGEPLACAPITSLSPPLPVFRSAEAWLRGGCDGCVPLDRLAAARIFLDGGGPLQAEDRAHAAELDAAQSEVLARRPAIVFAEAA